MAKVYSPNKKYDGITAGVQFSNGVGETADKRILQYLREKGYTVEDGKPTVDTELESLKQEATKLGVKFNPNIGKAKLIEKIEEAKALQLPQEPITPQVNNGKENPEEIDPYEE